MSGRACAPQRGRLTPGHRRTAASVVYPAHRRPRACHAARRGSLPIVATTTSPSLYRQAKAWTKKNQRNITAAINGSVVIGVFTGAGYGLLEVDLDISRGWTLTEFMVATASDDFLAYQQAATSHPFVTKAWTSGVAYTLGDFAAQTFQGRTIFDLDLRRSLRSGVAGFCIHGPLCHLWIEWMEANLSFGGAWYSTFVKVLADQTGWSLFLNSAYTSSILLLQGKGPSFVVEEVQATWWTAISSGWRFWPFVHMISFSPFIPSELKLLFIDTMEIIWVTILATVVNRTQSERGPKLSCSIEAKVGATQPHTSIELASKEQYQPVIEAADGTQQPIILATMEWEELNQMEDDADTAFLLASNDERDLPDADDAREDSDADASGDVDRAVPVPVGSKEAEE